MLCWGKVAFNHPEKDTARARGALAAFMPIAPQSLGHRRGLCVIWSPVVASMGLARQIQLLLWKNWTLRKRQKVTGAACGLSEVWGW